MQSEKLKKNGVGEILKKVLKNFGLIESEKLEKNGVREILKKVLKNFGLIMIKFPQILCKIYRNLM